MPRASEGLGGGADGALRLGGVNQARLWLQQGWSGIVPSLEKRTTLRHSFISFSCARRIGGRSALIIGQHSNFSSCQQA
jgi:hypothetical protein